MRVGLLTEVGLILEDVFFIFTAPSSSYMWRRLYYRIPFACLTTINVVLLLVVGFQLKILVDVFWPCFCCRKRQALVHGHDQ
jgi:hypothetical protein